MTKNILITLISTSLMVTMTTGCSGDDEYIFEHGPAGPNTERTLEKLPEGLKADKVKAKHSSDTLQPEI